MRLYLGQPKWKQFVAWFTGSINCDKLITWVVRNFNLKDYCTWLPFSLEAARFETRVFLYSVVHVVHVVFFFWEPAGWTEPALVTLTRKYVLTSFPPLALYVVVIFHLWIKEQSRFSCEYINHTDVMKTYEY